MRFGKGGKVFPRNRTGWLLTLLMIGYLCVLGKPVSAEPGKEYELKAAFLFNFAKFVEWSDDAFAGSHSPIILGVLGKDPFGSLLDKTLADKIVRGRKFVVKRFESLREIQSCHILFVSSSEKHRLREVLDSMCNRPVLTVGETPGFATTGGIINFFIEENKIRFEINHQSCYAPNLKISSQLLKLARVIDGSGEGK